MFSVILQMTISVAAQANTGTTIVAAPLLQVLVEDFRIHLNSAGIPAGRTMPEGFLQVVVGLL
jgi:hypothetical protein